MNVTRISWGIVAVALFLVTLVSTATAKYSGGTGEPNDPYQIATAADLIALGEDPNDYDKHFILTADIDLDPNLPGGRVFDKAVIGPGTFMYLLGWEGTRFPGVFDGDGHTISHLTITGGGCLGLFGWLQGEVRNLGVVDINIAGSGACYVGGLVGYNGGSIISSYSTGAVSGGDFVGGLVGDNWGTVTQCHSTAAVSGNDYVGGLVGCNEGSIISSYSTGAASGKDYVGGLVGFTSWGTTVTQCYSAGAVSGTGGRVGGLVGSTWNAAVYGVWDMERSGLSVSAGGVGLITTQMMDPYTLGLNGFGNDPNWVLDAGRDYPRPAWEGTAGHIIPEPHIDWLEGHGTPEVPYHLDTAAQLIRLGKASILWDKHFILGSDIDLDPDLAGRQVLQQAAIQTFAGVFDGNDHVISNMVIDGASNLGLFGQLAPGAEVKNLGIVDVNIAGSGDSVGGLVGENGGAVAQCFSTGAVSGGSSVGGLVGWNCYGAVTECYSTGAVSGYSDVGGLVGSNWYDGTVTSCFWDIQTSGQTKSARGTGLTTAEMQTAQTFLDSGWDFVGETANGTEDIWWINEGKDYPHLWWEAHD